MGQDRGGKAGIGNPRDSPGSLLGSEFHAGWGVRFDPTIRDRLGTGPVAYRGTWGYHLESKSSTKTVEVAPANSLIGSISRRLSSAKAGHFPSVGSVRRIVWPPQAVRAED